MKATLIATETEGLQEMLGLSYPSWPQGQREFLSVLPFLRVETLMFGRKQQNSVKQVSFN